MAFNLISLRNLLKDFMSSPLVSNNFVVLKIKSCQNNLIKWSSNL